MKSGEGFVLSQDKQPAGDQPAVIRSLNEGLEKGAEHQTLLGVTGSGKTFTVANIIAGQNKPALVIAHNKTLAAQLTQEYREFFPENAVHYFVSYYDYYQPEAYMAVSDTYIAKEAMVNREIDRLRHATTQSLLTRRDVIVVASVSAIYGLGSPEEYERVHLKIEAGSAMDREDFVRACIGLYFERTQGELQAGKLRIIADAVEILPVNEEAVYRVRFARRHGNAEGEQYIHDISRINPLTRAIEEEGIAVYFLFPAKHFVSGKEAQRRAIANIKEEMKGRLAKFKREGKVVEEERLRRRTLQDLALIEEVGYCNGIENYSRHFDGRTAGEAPYTLLSYFPRTNDGKPDFLTIIDESHVTVPQIAGMYAGDKARKDNLVAYGFRLPSARDNRPLTFEEFEERVGQVIYTSATPGEYEKSRSGEHIYEQIIRPTGLTDPEISLRRITGDGEYPGQVKDFIAEARKEVGKGNRILATTLTKKTAEELAGYLEEAGIASAYLHSDIKTIERVELLTRFRKGDFDILVGVNLLREGLDLPEVTLVAILDADKEGFLRSETSLIQTIGRAARNAEGRVLLYADAMTGSLERAIGETNRRRKLQIAHNKKHNITPKTITKNIHDITEELVKRRKRTYQTLGTLEIERYKKAPVKTIREKERKMAEAVDTLDFETAAIIRDEIRYLQNLE